ncbi:HAMP domain-containing histidine kinase [Cyanobacteria bacterium FACHB-63]|nr:HAMP domain-containing histidine kinase [Cyanobacteria bacterium FACHB-63]
MTIEQQDLPITRDALEFRSTNGDGYDSAQFNRVYQQYVDQWAATRAILWARIVYHDPIQNSRQAVQSQSDSLLPYAFLDYLKSEDWLFDFPLVLTLTEIHLNYPTDFKGYICPIGYRNQSPEYLFMLAKESLTADWQHSIIQSMRSLMQYSELFLSYHRQHRQIELLEHIIQRVGHQLRNPLGLIALYAETLCRERPETPKYEYAAVIRETVQGLLTHLTELIYCGKSSQLKMTLCDLRSLIVESLKVLQPTMDQKHLQVQYPQSSLLMSMDRVQMKQVFDNLLSNAIDFSPECSTVTIEWTVFQGEVLIQISDQGRGLSPEDLQKVFNPFYSRRTGGTGLGLTIAKKVISDHEGSIWAQNNPQGGARFSLTMPRDRATVPDLLREAER